MIQFKDILKEAHGKQVGTEDFADSDLKSVEGLGIFNEDWKKLGDKFGLVEYPTDNIEDILHIASLVKNQLHKLDANNDSFTGHPNYTKLADLLVSTREGLSQILEILRHW